MNKLELEERRSHIIAELDKAIAWGERACGNVQALQASEWYRSRKSDIRSIDEVLAMRDPAA